MRAGCSCGRRVFFGTYSSADDIARGVGCGRGGGALLGVRHGVGDLLSLPPSRPRLLSSNPSPSTIALPFTLSHSLPFSLHNTPRSHPSSTLHPFLPVAPPDVLRPPPHRFSSGRPAHTHTPPAHDRISEQQQYSRTCTTHNSTAHSTPRTVRPRSQGTVSGLSRAVEGCGTFYGVLAGCISWPHMSFGAPAYRWWFPGPFGGRTSTV